MLIFLIVNKLSNIFTNILSVLFLGEIIFLHLVSTIGSGKLFLSIFPLGV